MKDHSWWHPGRHGGQCGLGQLKNTAPNPNSGTCGSSLPRQEETADVKKKLELRDDDGRSVGPKCRHTSPCKRAAGGAEDAKLLALETEEGIMSQGCKGRSARWMRQGKGFCPAASGGSGAPPTPGKHLGLQVSRSVVTCYCSPRSPAHSI